MSDADDQRTAETWAARDHVLHAHALDYSGPPECCGRAARAVVAEVDRLRAELADCRAERDQALTDVGRAAAMGSIEADRLRAALAETRAERDNLHVQLDIIYDAEFSRNDALQRRIEKLETRGDALADEVEKLLTGPVPDPYPQWRRLAPKVDEWRGHRDR